MPKLADQQDAVVVGDRHHHHAVVQILGFAKAELLPFLGLAPLAIGKAHPVIEEARHRVGPDEHFFQNLDFSLGRAAWPNLLVFFHREYHPCTCGCCMSQFAAQSAR